MREGLVEGEGGGGVSHFALNKELPRNPIPVLDNFR